MLCSYYRFSQISVRFICLIRGERNTFVLMVCEICHDAPVSTSSRPHVTITGGGPAGLTAAEVLADGGAAVEIDRQSEADRAGADDDDLCVQALLPMPTLGPLPALLSAAPNGKGR